MANHTVQASARPADHPRLQRLQNDEELTRVTTKYMVGTLEWAGPVYQALALFTSAVYDPYSGAGRAAMLGLVVLHIALAPLYYRGYGPFVHGGWWIPAYFLQCMLVSGLPAWLSPPHTYGVHSGWIPCSNYAAAAFLFLAFYPWLPAPLIRRRVFFESAMLAVYFIYFLVLSRLNNGGLGWLNVRVAALSFSWLLIGYLFGKTIGRMCVAAAQKQLEVQQRNFDEFFDFLHSHVKANIAAVRMELADPLRLREKLDELEETIGDYRLEILLAREQVPLALLFSERIRAFTGVLKMTETPRLGPLTVARPIGVLVGHALGDLLKNAANHGATMVGIRCDTSGGTIRLEIADDGPGFPASVLDDSARSLNRLRRAARDLGGDLTLRPGAMNKGSLLTLVAPLRVPEVAR